MCTYSQVHGVRPTRLFSRNADVNRVNKQELEVCAAAPLKYGTRGTPLRSIAMAVSLRCSHWLLQIFCLPPQAPHAHKHSKLV